MDKEERPNLLVEFQRVLDDRGVPCSTSDVYRFIEEIADGAAYRAIQRYPAPTGPMGATGAQGAPGAPGADAWDKYSWDAKTETMFKTSWKGIEFTFPLATCFVEGFPQGELNYGDINYIRTIYGNMVVETMAVFWRRAYDYHTDMQLFINEEDSCRLQSINESNSYPAPLKD